LLSIKVKKDQKEVFDTNAMLNHFIALQEKHRKYRINTKSTMPLDKGISKIDLQ